ncbi:MAG: hypothetical protein A2W98_04995 [Bacteroidetes bacterium GWF2_33_38]|nr:MAG: hypothetical protein A2W98_04995 [Bacteroidetes bacterium GWF2_33_38]
MLLLFAPIYLYQSFFFFDFFSGTIRHLHTDHYLYGDFSNSLKLFGVESKFTDLNFYSTSDLQLIPYHYSELWITAFFSMLLNISSVNSYFLIVIPVCATIYGIGLFSLVENIKTHRSFKFIFTYMSLFISGVYFSFYDNWEITGYIHQSDNGILSFLSQKFCFIYICILFSVLLFIKEKKELGIIFLSTIPIFSINFAPSIIGGIVLYYLYSFIIKKERLVLSNIGGLLSALYVILFILLFYSLFKSKYSNEIIDNDIFLIKILNNNFSSTDLKIFIGNNVYRIIRALIFYFPYVILLVYAVKQNRQLSILFLFIIISGILTSTFLFDALNAGQFASNTYIIFNVLIAIGLSILLDKMKTNLKKSIFVFTIFISSLSLSLFTSFSIKNQYLSTHDYMVFKKIDAKLEKTSNILVFLNEKDFSDIMLVCWQSKNDLLPLTQYSDKDIIFSLGNPELYFLSNANVSSSDSLHYKYIFPFNKNRNNDINYYNIIDDKGIKYLYVKDGVEIPFNLKKRIDSFIESKEFEGTLFFLN